MEWRDIREETVKEWDGTIIESQKYGNKMQ